MDKTIPYTLKEANPMKTKEELNALKEEVETVSRKLHELTKEELEQVTGGKKPKTFWFDPPQGFICPNCQAEFLTHTEATCPYCGYYPCTHCS